MITLRKEQVHTLDDGYAAFEVRTAAWLEKHFPEDCAMLGENGLREKIRYTVQVAVQHGFFNRPEVSKFVFLSFLLGPNFDLQPKFRWLKAILADANVEPAARMGRAVEALAARLETGEITVRGGEQQPGN